MGCSWNLRNESPSKFCNNPSYPTNPILPLFTLEYLKISLDRPPEYSNEIKSDTAFRK